MMFGTPEIIVEAPSAEVVAGFAAVPGAIAAVASCVPELNNCESKLVPLLALLVVPGKISFHQASDNGAGPDVAADAVIGVLAAARMSGEYGTPLLISTGVE
jgi:hypothetical protein